MQKRLEARQFGRGWRRYERFWRLGRLEGSFKGPRSFNGSRSRRMRGSESSAGSVVARWSGCKHEAVVVCNSLQDASSKSKSNCILCLSQCQHCEHNSDFARYQSPIANCGCACGSNNSPGKVMSMEGYVLMSNSDRCIPSQGCVVLWGCDRNLCCDCTKFRDRPL